MLSDAWLGAVVCESNIMITMTNNLLCILHDVGYIQILFVHDTCCQRNNHSDRVLWANNADLYQTARGEIH